MKHSLLFVVTLFLSAVVYALEPAEELQQLLSKTSSFSAEFHQRVLSEEGDLLQESNGDIILQRPYKMHWQTREPFGYEVVTDGKTLWRYDPDLEQLNTEDFSDNLANTPVMVLVSATDRIAEQFTVSPVPSETGQGFRLVPREESTFTELTMLFVEGVLTRMTLHDHLGQETAIELDKTQINIAYPEEQFTFSAPDSVEDSFSFGDFGTSQ